MIDDFGGDGRGGIDLSRYFHNVTAALDNYRALKIYTDTALEHLTLVMDAEARRYRVDATLYSVAQNKAVTAAIVEHMERMLEQHRQLCILYGCERRNSVLRAKYFDLPREGGGVQPYDNMQLADWFDVDERTIRRDLLQGKQEMAILLFGAREVRQNENNQTNLRSMEK
ncbi:MAG: hypothetical protein M0P13_09440 [Fibrobacteraceae bacterium]|nr:hypothetical protein [Fibrobacteraceae bacterium]